MVGQRHVFGSRLGFPGNLAFDIQYFTFDIRYFTVDIWHFTLDIWDSIFNFRHFKFDIRLWTSDIQQSNSIFYFRQLRFDIRRNNIKHATFDIRNWYPMYNCTSNGNDHDVEFLSLRVVAKPNSPNCKKRQNCNHKRTIRSDKR